MYINVVPNKISRKALVTWVSELGLDASRVTNLEVSPDTIRVTVKALNEDLKPYAIGEELATYTLTIEVTDDDD